jgi:putative PIN family toxin of toxin-antitoxin system
VLVVLDTNVLVSSVFWGGNPERILIGWQMGRFDVVASPAIFWKYEATLRDLGRGMPEKVEEWIRIVHAKARLIMPLREVQLCRDPKDDKFLSCALAARVACIISGDRDLGDMGKIETIPILKPAAFVGQYLAKPK